MSGGHLDEAELEALAQDEPAAPGSAAHAGSCLRCAGALAERRRERRALGRWSDRRDGAVDHLWAGLEARLPRTGPQPLVRLVEQQPPSPRRWPVRAALGLAAAAGLAAALALVPRSQPRPSSGVASAEQRPAAALAEAEAAAPGSPAAAPPAGPTADDDLVTPSARAALERAEGEYRAAAAALEAQVGARSPAGAAAQHRAAAMARARSALGVLHASGREPRARVRLLEGYSAYLKSLRRELDAPREASE